MLRGVMTKSSSLAAAVAVAWLLPACLGVETYRERGPAPSLSIRMVAEEGREGEVLPRWSGSSSEMLAIEHGAVVSAAHIRHVRLLDAADGSRVLVLELDDTGKARLAEASSLGIGRRLAIVVDGRIVAAPTIRNALAEGEAYVQVPPDDVERAFQAMSAPE